MDDDDDLQFCWDNSNAASNVEKHGVPFEMATYVSHHFRPLRHSF
jgi:uncharacterized DUF497 family protein